MAQDFCTRFAASKRVFDQASESLGFDVAAMCWGEDARLDLTEFTQLCILTAEIAMFEALKEHPSFTPRFFGGHSLGEYTALVAAGAIPFETALQLVHARGRLMQSSVPVGYGAMAAVILEDLPHAQVEALADAHEVDFANDNSNNQIVLSGAQERLDAVCAQLTELHPDSGIRVVRLAVSAPFHSRHMAEAQMNFAETLRQHAGSFCASAARFVVSNYTGAFHTGRLRDLMNALISQISGRVRWRENMNALVSRADALVEVGPDRPLTGFFRSAGVTVPAIVDLRTARRALTDFDLVFSPMPAARLAGFA